MSDKDLKKRIRISDVVFKDVEDSLMILEDSLKIVIFVYVLQEVGQPILDIHSGNLAAAHHRVHDCSILGSIVVLAEEVVLT